MAFMPQQDPPFLPENFNLGEILESGAGQIGIPLLMAAAPAIFGQTGGRVAQGFGAGINLIDQVNQRRKAQGAQQRLGSVFRKISTPTPSPDAEPAAPLASPVTPEQRGQAAQQDLTFRTPAPETPGLIEPRLGELLAGAAETGTLDDVIKALQVSRPDPLEALRAEKLRREIPLIGQPKQPTPLDPVTEDLRRAQADRARRPQETEAQRAEREARAGLLNRTAQQKTGQLRTPKEILADMKATGDMISSLRLAGDNEMAETGMLMLQALQDEYRMASEKRGAMMPRKPATPDDIQQALDEVGGDPNDAKDLLKARGFDIR